MSGTLAPPLFTLHGEDENDIFGRSLAAGDVNGDGRDDLIVGAQQADGPEEDRRGIGEVHVFLGGSTLGGDIDLAGGASDMTMFGGPGSGDRLGVALAVGDVNGDGVQDIIAGAFRADVPKGEGEREDAGAVYVVFGRQELAGGIDFAEEQFDAAIYGAEPFDLLGGAIAAADFNADGIDDLLIGATGGDGPDNAALDAGEAYVVAGSPSLSGMIDLASTTPLVTLTGLDQFDHLGASLAAADVNGDEIADMLIGAEGGDGPENAREEAGEAYIVFGSKDVNGIVDASSGADIVVYGRARMGFLGQVIAAGDVTADGNVDLILGSPGVTEQEGGGPTGAVHIVAGGKILPEVVDLGGGGRPTVLTGAAAGDRLGGCAVTPCAPLAVMDINGDGTQDLLVGSSETGRDSANDAAARGRIYVVSGPIATERAEKLDAGISDTFLSGGRAGDALGNAVVVLDVDGDGAPEIITGAPDVDGPDGKRMGAGAVYVLRPPRSNH